jgi:hypothetical protein
MLLERPDPPPPFDPNKAAMDKLFGKSKRRDDDKKRGGK